MDNTDLSYNAVKQRALMSLQQLPGSSGGSTNGYQQFSGSSTADPNQNTNRTLNQLSTTLGANNTSEGSIMDAYQNRIENAKSLLASQQGAISASYDPQIAQQKIDNQNIMDAARAGMNGPGVNTAVMRDMETTAAKRIRDLTATRDSLLMNASTNSATQIDNLIAQEQANVTQARQNYYSNMLGLAGAQNTSSLIPSQIKSNVASATNTLASAGLTNTQTAQNQLLLSLLGGTGSTGSTPTGAGASSDTGAIDLNQDAQDLASGKLAPATALARYQTLGPLGAIMYSKLIADAKKINPNFSETQSNLNYQGQQANVANLNSGNPITSLFANARSAIMQPASNQGSLFNFLNPSKTTSKTLNSGKTSSGMGYSIIGQ